MEREPGRSRRARICMPTARAITRRAYQCNLYEAQDVLVEMDDVDLVCLKPRRGFETKAAWQRRLLFRDVSKRLVFLNPGLERVSLDQEYDLFVAVCQNHWDLLYLNAIQGWKEHCRTSVCWLDELWVADLPASRYWLHALEQFDHVFVGYSGTVGPLSRILGRTCHWLAGAVDTVRFTPYPRPPARGIDVYSVGRRWGGIHEALLRAADRREIFYIYDSFPSMANLEPYDAHQHRELLANLIRRSRYFTVAPGKMNLTGETRAQSEIGQRYFEGAAGGAVMVGQSPSCPAFGELFNWPDAVIELDAEGNDVMAILRELSADPDRLAAIGRRNATEALLRHDWMYRWREILRVAGVPEAAGMASREARLRELARGAGVAGGDPLRRDRQVVPERDGLKSGARAAVREGRLGGSGRQAWTAGDAETGGGEVRR